jgi:hypothetical protein
MQLNTKKLREIVYKEGNLTLVNITKNMIKERSGFYSPYTTGRTATSIRVEAEIDSLEIWAPDHIDTLETGISPARSKANGSVANLATKIYQWTIDKPIEFLNGVTPKQRARWSMRQAKKQQRIGSFLYRQGGRTDIYSNEAEPLQNRLAERITKEIINTKIL